MQEFLQRLRNTYGDISVAGILNRQKNIYGEDLKNKPQEDFFSTEKNAPQSSLDSIKNLFIVETPETEQNKISPVNIANVKDWVTLRANAADLHDLKNFFIGKTDSQSPLFFKILDQYQNFISKDLSTPQDIDEESSTDFVSKLSNTIKNWFYKILDAIHPGLAGKGSEPVGYYKEIKSLVEKYFAQIGLKSEEIKPRASFHKWQERMKAIETPAPFEHLHNLIEEVIIQPHYFEYYDEDGQLTKSWIEGKCTVFKFMRRA